MKYFKAIFDKYGVLEANYIDRFEIPKQVFSKRKRSNLVYHDGVWYVFSAKTMRRLIKALYERV